MDPRTPLIIHQDKVCRLQSVRYRGTPAAMHQSCMHDERVDGHADRGILGHQVHGLLEGTPPLLNQVVLLVMPKT